MKLREIKKIAGIAIFVFAGLSSTHLNADFDLNKYEESLINSDLTPEQIKQEHARVAAILEGINYFKTQNEQNNAKIVLNRVETDANLDDLLEQRKFEKKMSELQNSNEQTNYLAAQKAVAPIVQQKEQEGFIFAAEQGVKRAKIYEQGETAQSIQEVNNAARYNRCRNTDYMMSRECIFQHLQSKKELRAISRAQRDLNIEARNAAFLPYIDAYYNANNERINRANTFLNQR